MTSSKDEPEVVKETVATALVDGKNVLGECHANSTVVVSISYSTHMIPFKHTYKLLYSCSCDALFLLGFGRR